MNHSQPQCRARLSSGQARGKLAAAACLLLAGQPVQAQSAGEQVVSFPAAWRIDDVEYLGQWDFARKGRLSDALRAAASVTP